MPSQLGWGRDRWRQMLRILASYQWIQCGRKLKGLEVGEFHAVLKNTSSSSTQVFEKPSETFAKQRQRLMSRRFIWAQPKNCDALVLRRELSFKKSMKRYNLGSLTITCSITKKNTFLLSFKTISFWVWRKARKKATSIWQAQPVSGKWGTCLGCHKLGYAELSGERHRSVVRGNSWKKSVIAQCLALFHSRQRGQRTTNKRR